MSRPINGMLYVETLSATGNPGEYTLENAPFSNVSDATGTGALDLTVGAVIFIPASDPNTFFPVPGVWHRYKIIALQVDDPSAVASATILWDEPGDEQDVPTSGSYCLVAEVSPGLGLALLTINELYPELSAGAALGALLVDQRNLVDKVGGGSSIKQATSPMVVSGDNRTVTTPFPTKAGAMVIYVDQLYQIPDQYEIVGANQIRFFDALPEGVIIGGFCL